MKKKDATYQVCVVTGTRAEYGLLKRVIGLIKKEDKMQLNLVVTGSHLSNNFGNTQQEIIADGIEEFYRIFIPIEEDSKRAMAQATGVAMELFSEYYSNYKPDVLVVLGDRFEIFAAVSAAYLMGIPIAHIAGGDVTEGAVDDAIRHCITKMSSLHFPGCEDSAKRIVQMGEQPSSVYNVGDTGIENCIRTELMSREELSKNLSCDWIMNDYAVVTFHPVTLENHSEKKQMKELIEAMKERSELSYVITLSNADAGGRLINEMWIEEKKDNWLVIPSLGLRRYLSAIKYAKAVIGNSSSGIFEAPVMKTPTVNIGDRQKGRMQASSIINCRPNKEDISKAIRDVITKKDTMAYDYTSMYGNGTTSEQIVSILLGYLEKKRITNKKTFYDINYSEK